MSTCWCPHVAAPHTYCGSIVVCTTSAESYQCVLCDLETSRCPRPVLCTRQDTRATFSSEVQARVRSRTRAPLTTLAVGAGAGVGVSSNVGLRDRALYAHRRSVTQSFVCRSFRVERSVSGASPGRPVRRQAHLRLSLSRSNIFADQKRSCALPCPRRPEPMYAPRSSRLFPDAVLAPIWPAMSDRQDDPARIRRRLRRTPT
jgi:hypothetical protein